MSKRIGWIGAGVVALVLAPLLVGCEGSGGKRHEVTAAQSDQVLGCQKCYDETIQVRRMHGKGAPYARTQTITRHMCPDCKGDMKTYTEDGRLMIKCTQCAPEGAPCNRCLPPEKGA